MQGGYHAVPCVYIHVAGNEANLMHITVNTTTIGSPNPTGGVC